jgi:hypothetical protein
VAGAHFRLRERTSAAPASGAGVGAMSFDRNQLPNALAYFEGEGLKLQGRGKWRTTRCDFHDGSDSMRVNTESGAWVCMACGAKGGDVLAYAMQRHDLQFVEACKSLGAWINDGRPQRADDRPRTLSPRAAMEVIAHELLVLIVVIADARRGLTPSDTDWQRFLEGAGRIDLLAAEYRS